jgi:hypothetical protein
VVLVFPVLVVVGVTDLMFPLPYLPLLNSNHHLPVEKQGQFFPAQKTHTALNLTEVFVGVVVVPSLTLVFVLAHQKMIHPRGNLLEIVYDELLIFSVYFYCLSVLIALS